MHYVVAAILDVARSKKFVEDQLSEYSHQIQF
jgi:hypothetical protein